jgi:hypothetical protein
LKLAHLARRANPPSIRVDDPHFDAIAALSKRKVSWAVKVIKFGNRSGVIDRTGTGLTHAETSAKDIPAGAKRFQNVGECDRSFHRDGFASGNKSPEVAEVDRLVERSLGEVSEDGGKKEIGTECICNIQLARPFEQV